MIDKNKQNKKWLFCSSLIWLWDQFFKKNTTPGLVPWLAAARALALGAPNPEPTVLYFILY